MIEIQIAWPFAFMCMPSRLKSSPFLHQAHGLDLKLTGILLTDSAHTTPPYFDFAK
jgi:hypothetical protein